MKKNTKNKKKNTEKIVPLIIGITGVILLIAGGTYAYWQWRGNNTIVNFEISGATFNITGTPISMTNIVPIADCYSETYDIDDDSAYVSGSGATVNNFTSTTTHTGKYTAVGNFTATAINDTSTEMTAIIVLKARLKAGTSANSTAVLTSSTLTNLKWAISEVEETDLENYSYTNCDASTSGTYANGNFTLTATPSTETNGAKTSASLTQGNTGAWVNIHTKTGYSNTISDGKTLGSTTGEYYDITFEVPAKQTVIKHYQLYVWLDAAYEGPANFENSIYDPMQGATLEVSFANSAFGAIKGSRLEQKIS